MRRALVAALAYVAMVFAVAFVFGVLRVLVLAPRLGETAAVLVELPAVLAVSWWSCGASLGWFGVGSTLGERLVMGAAAFVILQAAEALLAIGAFGRDGADYLAAMATLPGLIGLGGQILFALIPLVRRRG